VKNSNEDALTANAVFLVCGIEFSRLCCSSLRQFDEFASSFALAVEGRKELSQHLLRRMDELAMAIGSHSATTLDGLRVKARVAAWALLGDFCACQNCSLANDMSMSIIRDLIRNFDPNCESPGAIARLINSATS
jgi:hypothetical protein